MVESNKNRRFEFIVPFSFHENEFVFKITSICSITGKKHPDLKIKAIIKEVAEVSANKKMCKLCHEKLL